MAEKPIIGEPIFPEEEWSVSTYLIAITPNLKSSVKQQREQKMRTDEAKAAAEIAASVMNEEPAMNMLTDPYNEAHAKKLFEEKCSLCHPLTDVEDYPPRSKEETTEVISRMIDNGLFLEEREIELITRYVNDNYLDN